MSGPRLLLAAVGLAIAMTLGGFVDAASETVVFVANHRTPEELAPLAETVLGEEGVARPDGEALVLIGTPEAVRRAVELLEARDVARPIVTLRLDVRTTAMLDAAGYEVRWAGADGLRTGALVNRGRGARTLSTGRQENAAFTLQVRDGATGRIDLGRSVPVLSRWLFGGSTAFVEARSEMRATPRVLGNGDVHLALAWSKQEVDNTGRTVGGGGSTTVEVPAGEVVVLGALSRKLDSRGGRVYGSRSERSQSDEQVVLVWVDVE